MADEGLPVAIGFTVKSGWASAVVVGLSAALPALIDAQRISLSDPDVPDARQPYHAGFGTARGQGRELTRLVRSVERFGRRSVTRFIDACRAPGYRLSGAGLVVGSLIDPDRIANAHIRIHALEGRLFRGVIQSAADEACLQSWIWRERDLYGFAAEDLRRPERVVRRTLTALGRTTGGPWRTEQKSAALAAWLVLAGAGARGAAGERDRHHDHDFEKNRVRT